MATTYGFNPEVGIELTKAIADRHGIPHDLIRPDGTFTQGAGDSAWVTLQLSIRMSNQEFNDLFRVAQERAAR